MAEFHGFIARVYTVLPRLERCSTMMSFSTRRGSFERTRLALYRALLILLALVAMGITGSGQRTTLPAKLEHYLNTAGALSRDERQLLLAGQPVTKLLDSD